MCRFFPLILLFVATWGQQNKNCVHHILPAQILVWKYIPTSKQPSIWLVQQETRVPRHCHCHRWSLVCKMPKGRRLIMTFFRLIVDNSGCICLVTTTASYCLHLSVIRFIAECAACEQAGVMDGPACVRACVHSAVIPGVKCVKGGVCSLKMFSAPFPSPLHSGCQL